MLKRCLDVTIALTALLMMSPLLLGVAVVLRLTGTGQVLYIHDRVGLAGDDFKMFKFATMAVGSERLGTKDITSHDDPRVLPVGKFLRRTKINELPQLLNVVLGQMSLVGWRPLLRAGFERYPVEVQRELTAIKPGVTGIGSVVFRDEESILMQSSKSPEDCYRDEILPDKAALELWYIRHQSSWTDIKILLATIVVVLAPSRLRYLSWFHDLPQRRVDV